MHLKVPLFERYCAIGEQLLDALSTIAHPWPQYAHQLTVTLRQSLGIAKALVKSAIGAEANLDAGSWTMAKFQG